MSLAPRISRSSGVPVYRSHHCSRVLCPTNICVIPCSRANFNIVSIGSSPVQDFDVRLGVARNRQVAFQRGLIVGGNLGLPYVRHGQVAMEPIRVALAAGDHHRAVGPRRDAHQDSLLRAKRLRDSIALQVLLQLAVHHVGGQQQCDLAEFRQLLRLAGGAGIRFAIRARDAHLGRRIHHHDFVRGIEKAAWYGLRSRTCR